ncbi:hypothetical protein VTK26DRAFT_6055 [Humicola hyalothermophila]
MVSTNYIQLLATYIDALHILHHHGVLDGYGHLSVRNPNNPSTFFMSHRDLAPALVSGLDDIGEYRVSDAEPVGPDTPPTYLERFIHSEIYQMYSEVDVVLHGHAEELVSFSVSVVPLRPVVAQAAFFGDRVPVFDISRYYLPNETHTLLVDDARLGAAMAREFSSSSPSSPAQSEREPPSARALPSYPAHNLVLMQCHGFTTVATDLKIATFQGVYAVVGARVQARALQIQHAYTGGAAGTAFSGGDGGLSAEGLEYLTPRQVRDSMAVAEQTVERPWGLWVREVRASPVYVNEIGGEEV